MQRLLLISDDHGDENTLINICKKHDSDCLYKIHLGDSLNTDTFIKKYFDIAVRGNNDNNNLNIEEVFEIDNLRFLAIHGDHLLTFWKSFDENLYLLAKKYNCQVVIHGHLHIPVFKKYKGVTIISPGSIRLPRQSPKEKTYAILNILENKNLKYELLKI